MATISVSEDTRKELLKLKIEEGEKNLDSLIRKMIANYKRYKFLKTSTLFKRKLKEKGFDISDIASEELLVIEFEAKKDNRN